MEWGGRGRQNKKGGSLKNEMKRWGRRGGSKDQNSSQLRQGSSYDLNHRCVIQHKTHFCQAGLKTPSNE